MTPDEFRQAGHELIDWIADYRQSLDERPVRAQVTPGQVRESFAAKPPAGSMAFSELLGALEHQVVPGITQVQSPMHFGWFPSNATLASVLGDIASSGLGTLGISWESCPSLTEVEEVTTDWMRQLVGLSDQWHGTIHDTASTACLTALLAARERTGEFCMQTGGLQGLDKPLVIYSTPEAHSSVEKAALLAGFGRANLRLVDMDPATRAMNSAALAQAISDDIEHGRIPCAVVASIGSTGVTAFDPLKDIVSIAQDHNIWVHVDAAMAGTAMMLPECRHLWDGVEDADSISWNPHKWMGTILDTSLFYVRDIEHLVRVMSTNPSYLQSEVDGGVVQYRDWGIPLGRRFRALKLWFHLEIDGPDAIRERLRRDLDNARWLAAQVEASPQWELVAPLTLQTVCMRHCPPGLDTQALNEHTLSWVRKINESGKAFLSPSKLNGQWMVRASSGVEATEHEHVQELWAILNQATA